MDNTDYVNDIDSEIDSINQNAAELREAISELKPHNEDELLIMVDNIKEASKEIASLSDKIEDKEECECDEYTEPCIEDFA